MLLSKIQKRVMTWVGHGHAVRAGEEQTVTVNGVHLCSQETMLVLTRLGLVVKGKNDEWIATEEGKAITEQLRL